jgi:hypothetical protein
MWTKYPVAFVKDQLMVVFAKLDHKCNGSEACPLRDAVRSTMILSAEALTLVDGLKLEELESDSPSE